MLEAEIKYFEQNYPQLAAQHPGKFVLIKNDNLIGVFDTLEAALTEGARQYNLESFLVRQIIHVQREIKIPALALGLLHANPSHTVQRSGPDT
jgi:hypothetical protein